jgi:alpha-1,3-rhamnosyl/mannosyltransferase
MPCPAVVTVHDFHDFRSRWWYFRRILDRTFATAAGIICVSQATHQQLVEEFPQHADKAVVIREGADPNVFHPNGEATSVLRRLRLDAPPLLAVGTVQPRKNYARLIEAYAGLPREGTPPLVIVGQPGWDYKDVMAMPARLGVADRVTFAGHMSETDVGDLMRASVLLCAVSTGEGFGLPLVEAMYSGLPIVASDIPPFREVAGNAARFVNPFNVDEIASGISSLLESPKARTEMAATGLRRRQLFSWDVAATAIVDVVRRALTYL